MVDEGRGVRTCLCCEDEDLKNTAFATTHTFTHTHIYTHTHSVHVLCCCNSDEGKKPTVFNRSGPIKFLKKKTLPEL